VYDAWFSQKCRAYSTVVFWVMTSCNPIGWNQRFDGAYCFHIYDRSSSFLVPPPGYTMQRSLKRAKSEILRSVFLKILSCWLV